VASTSLFGDEDNDPLLLLPTGDGVDDVFMVLVASQIY